ncbi:hypothetical protein HFD88_002567 [Aspergillus terreus]|nr:hypothetical protein HFD88_002567 [Aspergillus terreus]
MVKLDTFEIDHWVLTRSPGAKHNLAHSYVRPISLHDLETLPYDGRSDANILKSIQQIPLDYGSSFKGLPRLRENISRLYPVENGHLSPEHILTTPGASLANLLIYLALIGPGDHVIVQYPTYQQLYSVPAALGADLCLWRANQEDGWELDLEELKGLIRPNTKMIVLNNPQNPTGAILGKSTLEKIVEIAKANKITILSDEIYRPTFYSPPPGDADYPPSILSMGYANVVATSSLSKMYSLAGIRVGWIASNSPSIIDLCINARAYGLITVSQVDEQIAASALSPSCAEKITHNNDTLAKHNLEIVQAWIDERASVARWTRPSAGPIGFVQFTRSDQSPIDDVRFCNQLLETKGVLLVPGSKCFGPEFAGYVRLGFGMETQALIDGLQALAEFIKESYDDF